MVPALAGMLIGCGGLFVALFVSALLLRAAAASANRIVGRPGEDAEFEFGDWDDWDSDEPPRRRRREKASIPEPGVGRGMFVAFASAFATAMAWVVLEVVAEGVLGLGGEEAQAVLVLLVALPAGFGALTFLLAGLLPTTFRRAALVAFLYHLYGLAIVVAVVCTIWGCLSLAKG
jgi:hypothetical protein